jgi:hypothetical protein
MLDIGEIEGTLRQIAALLRANEAENMARVFDRIAAQVAQDPGGARSDMLSMYGGAGSFNDIVLHKDGEGLVTENDALDELREKLWDLIHPGPNDSADA